MLKRRVIALALIGISAYFSLHMYWYAPWYIDTTDFLYKPLLLVALPFLLLGGVFWIQAAANWPLELGGILLCFGALGMLFLGGWPPPNAVTTINDSYELLGVYTGVWSVVGGFMWCTWVLLVLAMGRTSSPSASNTSL